MFGKKLLSIFLVVSCQWAYSQCAGARKAAESKIPESSSLEPPSMVTSSPGNNSENNSIFSYVSITFSESMERSSLGDTTELGLEGSAIEFTRMLQVDASACSLDADTFYEDGFCHDYLRLEEEITWTGNTLIVKPTEVLDYQSRYRIKVLDVLRDTTGQVLQEPIVFTFVTNQSSTSGSPDLDLDKVGTAYFPAVLPRTATDPETAGFWATSIPTTLTFVVRFTKQMDIDSTEDAVTLQKCTDDSCSSINTSVTTDMTWNGNSLNITNTTALDTDGAYLLSISDSARDVAQQNLANPYTFKFKVAAASIEDADAIDQADGDDTYSSCTEIAVWNCDGVSPTCPASTITDRNFHTKAVSEEADEDWYCFQHDGNKHTYKFEVTPRANTPVSSETFARLDVYSSSSGKTDLNAVLTPEFEDEGPETVGQSSSYQFTVPSGGSGQWYYIRISERFSGAPKNYTVAMTDFGGGATPPTLDLVEYTVNGDTPAGTNPILLESTDTYPTASSSVGDATVVPVDASLWFTFTADTASGTEMDWDSFKTALTVSDYLGNEVAGSFTLGTGNIRFSPDNNFLFAGGEMTPRFTGYLVQSVAGDQIDLQGGDTIIPLNAYIEFDGGYRGYVVDNHPGLEAGGLTKRITVWPSIVTQPAQNASLTEKFGGLYTLHITPSAQDTFDNSMNASSGYGLLTDQAKLVFVTEDLQDFTPPAVISQTPTAADDVPRNATISFQFSEDVYSTDPSCDPSNAGTYANCSEFNTNGAVTVTAGGSPVSITSAKWESGTDKTLVVVTLAALLPSTTTIEMSIDAAKVQDDVGNNPSSDFSFSFVTNDISDTTPPCIEAGGGGCGGGFVLANGTGAGQCPNISECPVDLVNLTLDFDEEMDAASVAQAITVTKIDTPPLSISFSVSAPDPSHVFTISIPGSGQLEYNSTYEISVVAGTPKDLVGNSLVQGDTLQFTTAPIEDDEHPPILDSVTLSDFVANPGGTANLEWSSTNKSFDVQIQAHDDPDPTNNGAAGINSVRAWLYLPDHDYATTTSGSLTTRLPLSLVANAGNPLSGTGTATFNVNDHRLYRQDLHGTYAVGLIEVRDQDASYPDLDTDANVVTYRMSDSAQSTYDEVCYDTMENCISGGSWSAPAGSITSAVINLKNTDPLPPVITDVKICDTLACDAAVNPAVLTAGTTYYITVNVADDDDTDGLLGNDAYDLPAGIDTVNVSLLPGDAYHFNRLAAINIPLSEASPGVYQAPLRPRFRNYPGRWSLYSITVQDAAHLDDCLSNCASAGNETYPAPNRVTIYSSEDLNDGSTATNYLVEDSAGTIAEYDSGSTVAVVKSLLDSVGPTADKLLSQTITGFLDKQASYATVTSLDMGDADVQLEAENYKPLYVRVTPEAADVPNPTDCQADAHGFCSLTGFAAPVVSNTMLHSNELSAVSIPGIFNYDSTNGYFEASFRFSNYMSSGNYALTRIIASRYQVTTGTNGTAGNINDWIWDAERTSNSLAGTEKYRLLQGSGAYYTANASVDTVSGVGMQSCPGCLVIAAPSGGETEVLLSIDGSGLTTSVTGGTLPDVSLTFASFTTLDAMCAELSGDGYTCIVRGDGSIASSGLAAVTDHDLVVANYTAKVDEAAHDIVSDAVVNGGLDYDISDDGTLGITVSVNNTAPSASVSPGKDMDWAVAFFAPPAETSSFTGSALLSYNTTDHYYEASTDWKMLTVELHRDGSGDLTGEKRLSKGYPDGDYVLAALLVGSDYGGMVYYAVNTGGGPGAADAFYRLQGSGGTDVEVSGFSTIPLSVGSYSGHSVGDLVVNDVFFDVSNNATNASPYYANLEFDLSGAKTLKPILSLDIDIYCEANEGTACNVPDSGSTPYTLNLVDQAVTIDVSGGLSNVNANSTGAPDDVIKAGKLNALSTGGDMTVQIEDADGMLYLIDYDHDGPVTWGGDYYDCTYVPILATDFVGGSSCAGVISAVAGTKLANEVTYAP